MVRISVPLLFLIETDTHEGRKTTREEKRISMMKAIIFDMDGVVVNSEPIHQRSEIEALAGFGLHLETKDLHPYAGTTRLAFQEGIEKQYHFFPDWKAVFQHKDQRFFELMEEVEAKEMDCLYRAHEFITQCTDLDAELKHLKYLDYQELECYTADPATTSNEDRMTYIHAICFEITHRMGEMNVHFQQAIGCRFFYSEHSGRIFLFEPSDNKFSQFYQGSHTLVTHYYLIEMYYIYTRELISLLSKYYYGIQHRDAAEVNFYRDHMRDTLDKIFELNRFYTKASRQLSQIPSHILLDNAPEEHRLLYHQMIKNYQQVYAKIYVPFSVPVEPMSTSNEFDIKNIP